MTGLIHIIIVTHNSSDVLPRCLTHLAGQSVSITSITIVDSGSTDTHYLDDFAKKEGIKLILSDNIGFARANNLGYSEITDRDGVVVFLNPDTFLPENFLSQAVEVLSENLNAAIVSGKLLGFNPGQGEKTGKIDSTGIFRKWYGRWYDRGKGEDDSNRYSLIQQVPAVCGALMACRMESLHRYNGEVFDSDFFLYKEDIELSLRLRRDGWKLIYDPRLVACHCRGWQNKRGRVPFALRFMAAKNEVMLYQKHPSPYILWAFLKYLLVGIFRV